MQWTLLGGPLAGKRITINPGVGTTWPAPRVNPLAACDHLAACDACGQAFVAGTLHDGLCVSCKLAAMG